MSQDGKVLGTFCMYYREVRHPGTDDIQLIDYASRIAGIAIERERSRSALTMAFEEIKKSEAELRTIIDAIPQLIVAIGADGEFLYANQALQEYTVPSELMNPATPIVARDFLSDDPFESCFSATC